MPVRILLLVVIVLAGGYAWARFGGTAQTVASPINESVSAEPVQAEIDFGTQVQPILTRCQPCHFSGGVMYEKLPFDRAETVTKLGEKLFTRIKAENDRKIIRDFLAQESENK